MKKTNKKALMTALAIAITSGISASANANEIPNLSLNELSGERVLLAHGSCGERKCGLNKMLKSAGVDKKTKKRSSHSRTKSREHKCGEGKCGLSKILKDAGSDKKM